MNEESSALWQGVLPLGNITHKRKGCYRYLLVSKKVGGRICKDFLVRDYGEEAEEVAHRYRKKIAKEYNLYRTYYRFRDDDTAEVTLTNGKVAVVDRESLAKVLKHNWYAHYHTRNDRWYAEMRVDGTVYLMHRYLMPSYGRIIHLDADGLNNRLSNLAPDYRIFRNISIAAAATPPPEEDSGDAATDDVSYLQWLEKADIPSPPYRLPVFIDSYT